MVLFAVSGQLDVTGGPNLPEHRRPAIELVLFERHRQIHPPRKARQLIGLAPRLHLHLPSLLLDVEEDVLLFDHPGHPHHFRIQNAKQRRIVLVTKRSQGSDLVHQRRAHLRHPHHTISSNCGRKSSGDSRAAA